MKKNFNPYIVAWAIFFALFNVITFVIPSFPKVDKYTSSFWIGYIFIVLAFLGQAVCSYVAFKADSAKKLFYNVSLIKIGYSGLIASFIVGGLCMIISPLPYWIGIVLCAIILAFNLISVLKASVAIAEVQRIDEKVNTQTFFIKSLTVDANTLVASAPTDEIKAKCTKVYEAIRYSDPMSNDALASVENEISLAFTKLSEAVKANDTDAITTTAKEIIVLIDNRNNKCKLLK